MAKDSVKRVSFLCFFLPSLPVGFRGKTAEFVSGRLRDPEGDRERSLWGGESPEGFKATSGGTFGVPRAPSEEARIPTTA